MIIKEHAIGINWILNQILGGGKTDYQITKIDDNDLHKFLLILSENQFPMPDGTNVLRWMRNKLSLHHDQAINKMSVEWEKTRQRYRYIILEIDKILMKNAKDNLNKEVEQKVCSNELSVSF
jgi:hypothetical protein